MTNKNVFARNLQQLMDANHKTRRDVCNDLGLSYYTFSDWVNGKKYPRMDKVEMLAKYFGVTKSDLIEETSVEERIPDQYEKEFLELSKDLPPEMKKSLLTLVRMYVQDKEGK